MRLAALAFLVICNLTASQARAEDIAQPLTRAHCDAAGMAWDETANICVANSGDRSDQLIFTPELEDSASQPLTRGACEMAGLTWDDQANVCSSATQTATGESSSEASTVLITIDKDTQRMMVLVNGAEKYDWPVSTGLRGYSTPSGSYTASSMNKIWYSKEWDDAPMPHAVFFTKKGHAIHGTNEVKRLGKPASHGCVRLAPEHAAMLYDLVARHGLENTQIELSGLTPGGESNVASLGKSKNQYRRASRGDGYNTPRRRGGLLRRLFGRR